MPSKPRLLVVLLLTACGTDPERDRCEVALVADCPTCPPGDVRYALRGTLIASIAPRSDGVSVGVCDAVLGVDTVFADRWRTEVVVEDKIVVVDRVASAGDRTYAIISISQHYDDGSVLEGHALVALGADGSERWRRDLDLRGPDDLVAGAEGPYVVRVDRSERRLIDSYDVDGELRWSVERRGEVAPDGAGGVIVADGTYATAPEQPTATITRLGPGGNPLWTRTWQAVDGMPEPPATGSFFWIDDVAVAPGGVVVSGAAEAPSVDLGDRELDIPAGRRPMFVAMLDPATGATRWVTLAPASHVIGTDPVIVAGDYIGDGDSFGLPLPPALERDGYIAVVDATGVVRARALGGAGDQAITDLAIGPGGSVTVTVPQEPGDQLQVGSLQVGPEPDDIYPEYVLNLEP